MCPSVSTTCFIVLTHKWVWRWDIIDINGKTTLFWPKSPRSYLGPTCTRKSPSLMFSQMVIYDLRFSHTFVKFQGFFTLRISLHVSNVMRAITGFITTHLPAALLHRPQHQDIWKDFLKRIFTQEKDKYSHQLSTHDLCHDGWENMQLVSLQWSLSRDQSLDLR